ncbi:hypothetical protein E4T56_gene19839 [Termitomyces sp. T112]|nr:hypothetical protein E4T56_gene19839 [Termitomyces sp. T112]
MMHMGNTLNDGKAEPCAIAASMIGSPETPDKPFGVLLDHARPIVGHTDPPGGRQGQFDGCAGRRVQPGIVHQIGDGHSQQAPVAPDHHRVIGPGHFDRASPCQYRRRQFGHGNTGHQNRAALDQQNAAHAPNGDDIGQTSGGIQLLAKAMDIDLDGIRAEQILRPEQLVLGQPFGHHLSIPAQQKPQQSRLARRESNGLPVNPERKVVQIIDQIGAGQFASKESAIAAQYRPNSRHQFIGREGLGHIIIGPAVQSRDPGLHIPAPGQHDRGDAIASLPQALEQGQPVPIRQPPIQHEGGIDIGRQQEIGFLDRASQIAGQTRHRQIFPQRGSQRQVVLDQQYAHGISRQGLAVCLPHTSRHGSAWAIMPGTLRRARTASWADGIMTWPASTVISVSMSM